MCFFRLGGSLFCPVISEQLYEYGVTVSGRQQKLAEQAENFSNVLCVLERLDMPELEKLNPTVTWWVRQGQPAIIVFTLEELQRSADVFAVERLDIRASHRVLYGEDLFSELDVPMKLHRSQVERELRINRIRLREQYLAKACKRKQLLGLMTASVSTFTTLFRHALITLGEEPPPQKREVVDRLATVLGFDAGAFHTVLKVREGKQREREVNVKTTFGAYLEAVSQVVEAVDRGLAVAESEEQGTRFSGNQEEQEK